MSFELRLVVTGHTPDGVSVVDTDERVPSRSPFEGYDGAEIWETVEPHTRIRIVELGPGHRSPMHRTHTVDYALLLEGECELLLDEGSVHLRAGDVVVQRGTNHAWHVVGDRPARFAFLLIDAEPLSFGGVELPDTMPAGVDPD
jgi:quercetin dioxygenase-like cupin family protein